MLAAPLFGLFILFRSSSASAGAPTVSLPYGTFQGFTEGNLTKYLGVPFASASRFELPKAPKPLSGLQNATDFGPACPQQALSPLPGVPPVPYLPISEQCLTLDVITPLGAQNLSTLPVFVWIFPGGFQVGNSRGNDVSVMVRRSIETSEPIIGVAINYRINAFGFLPGKEVGAAGVSNLGLRDQIFALQWVKKHIASFGGDPSRVVLGGLSAGSISAATLLLSNKQNSNTLFRGVFLESGATFPAPTLEEGQSVYDSLVSANNCSAATDTLDCLRRVPFDSLMATINKTENVFSYEALSIVWRPYVDGDVVERAPFTSVSQGLYAKIPLMVGNCDDEGTLFSMSSLNITTDSEFSDYVHYNYLPKASQDQIAEIGRLYPSDPTQGSPFDTGTANQLSPEYKRLAAFQGDLMFIGGRRYLLEHASRTQNTWSWLSKLGKNASSLGATHTSDEGVWWTTNTTSVGSLGVDALVNFISTLDPNLPAQTSTAAAKLPVLWPQWKTPSAGGSSSLLTLTDNNGTIITADNFRAEAIGFLGNLLLEEAQEK
ncbi:sterol esterase [Mycena metata]|uniref:Carboxylic ester hydrolase n=1 Tax=Mycena metata TaxID=1033252 RepID=A0AAD7IC90_9AGAR|nr:sterol esterase [Mycena metata]